MTEQEWLTTDSPRLLLDYAKTQCLNTDYLTQKRREFVKACREEDTRVTGETYNNPHTLNLHDPESLETAVEARLLNEFDPPELDPPIPPLWQANILRDLFGNPFKQIMPYKELDSNEWVFFPNPINTMRIHDSLVFDAIILPRRLFTWNDGRISRMAQTIYKDKAFHDMPILADALEEAGCNNEEILNHCRAVCSYCKDATFEYGDSGSKIGAGIKDKELVEQVRSSLAAYHNKKCTCRGSRQLNHYQGCWVLDLFLPENNILRGVKDDYQW